MELSYKLGYLTMAALFTTINHVCTGTISILWISTFYGKYLHFVDLSVFGGYYLQIMDIVDISVLRAYYLHWLQ